MSDRFWREILEYARWAPSPHNTQHWKFRLVDDRRAVLCYDPARLLPVEDAPGRFMAAAFGILLETMSIAAAPLGLDVNVVPRQVGFDSTAAEAMPFADLELVERIRPEPLHRDVILQRRTSRLRYDDRPVSSTQLEEYARIAEQYGHRFEYSADPKEVAWVIGLNATTMYDDLRDGPTRREIGQWARYSQTENQRYGDGLSAVTMGFPGWMMKQFFERNWLFGLPVLRRLGEWNYARSMRGTRTVAWISGPFEETADCVHAGRMLARLWLMMSKHGVFLHPFGSVITNERSHRRLKERFANPQRQHPLWLLVRLGHSDAPPSSLRLSLEDLILK